MIGRYRALLLSVLVAARAAFYAAGATRHAEQVNLQKARGNQSGYPWDAERVYANWHGSSPPSLIGARNRMPLYAGFLALFYRPTMTDPEYFVVGRIVNIYLSLALLRLLWFVLRRLLAPWPAANLIGVAAFGWYIFKAGQHSPNCASIRCSVWHSRRYCRSSGRQPGRDSRITTLAGALTLRMRHFDALVSAVILASVAFRVWPRLMSTYGGF